MNKNNQMILNEQDVITSWLNNKDIDSAIFSDIDPINIYNHMCQTTDIDEKIKVEAEDKSNDFVERCTSQWYMPEEYYNLDLYKYLIDKCPVNSDYQNRVKLELEEFKKRGMFPVLKFLKYLVDTCENNNIILGVGRGSSVASYCLNLLGVHRVDSVKYKLDIKEFLK